MIYETEKYVEVLIKLRITPNQFFICWVLYHKQFDLLQRYISMSGKFDKAEIDDLISKDLILLTKKESYDVINMVVTLDFAETISIDAETAWEELWNAYPDQLSVNGSKFATKGLTISDERACIEKYAALLKKNKFLHNRIITLIEKDKVVNGGLARMKIDKFLVSKFWVELEKSEQTNTKPRLF